MQHVHNHIISEFNVDYIIKKHYFFIQLNCLRLPDNILLITVVNVISIIMAIDDVNDINLFKKINTSSDMTI